MATRRSLRPATAALALCTAAVTGVGLLPGVANAEPRPTIASVQRQVSSLEHKAEAAAERFHAATDAAERTAKRLTKVRAQVRRQEAKVEQMRTVLGQFAATNYRAGGIDPTLRLLLSDDPDTFLARASSVDRVSARQNSILRRTAQARAQLAQDRLVVARELGRLQKIEDRRAAEKKEIDAKAAKAQHLLDSLQEKARRRLEAARQAAADRAAGAYRASRSDVRASGGSSAGPVAYSGPASGAAAIAVRTALAQVGDSYVYAGNGPDVFDCSGLTTYAWRAAGVSLPRSSSMQYAAGRKVSASDLQPGDLVYYYSPISHVAMYIGGGQIVHASNPRDGVKISSVDSMPIAGATRP